ncbi:ATP-binding protein [Paenibacillaceae bacterium WGS1546]|uniref:hybrid sensor histidine kinase/response regulator n=1 Tax=Cohnella sp. WGS1546 TaxID=3366810 RepID=UPI00372D764F
MVMEKYRVYIAILLFATMMTAGRLIWLDVFKHDGQPYAVNGQLDLRDWDAGAGRTITLDGEWAFYPGVLLMSEGDDGSVAAPAHRVDIPSNWNALLQPNASTPYGFGSYRLTLLVGSDDEAYSVYVPSIRSSSELYINGKRMASSGRPASSAEEHQAENVPYIATFMADEQGTIELVIEAANYLDPRGGGLVRSIKFGTDEAIYREKQLSVATQLLIAAALVFQAIYLLLFFWIERNKFWLYFALALLSFTLILLNSSEDKLLLQWFPIPYAWSFKLLCLSLTLLFYALLRMVSEQIPEAWRAKALRAYDVAAVVGIAASVGLPPQNNDVLQYAIFLCATPIVGFLVVTVLRGAAKGIRGSLMQLLALLAFSNHMVWWLVFIFTGIKILFYPFDLILGMILFSSIWIRRYFVLYTEQKELTAKLEELHEKKDEFLANTSHELRNPLHGMISMSQVVLDREREAISETSIRELETVLKVGRRMSFMLNDLLDVVRLKENRLRLHRSSLALQPIVGGVVDMMRFMTDGKPVELKIRIPEPFPRVLADENRLIQILFNLLHNAVKFTHRGEVVAEAYVKNGQAHIVVSDTGIGMDEETMRRAFEPYEQAHARKGYEGGFGLGLSICKQLVELHGGTIAVRSAPDQGSRFVFTLQLDGASETRTVPEQGGQEARDPASYVAAAAADLAPEGRPDESPEPIERYVKDKPRILAVDDDALNLNVLVSLLARDAYATTAVTNGTEALALLHAQEWDLVIADIMMPGMSGYELARRIRERYAISELPILLLTARSQPEDIEQGFLAGANDYVTKPVDARELRARVQALTLLASSARERVRMEAAWLQAQIEPHFFLNTLNSIAALHTISSGQMLQLIDYFGDYLREKFKFQNVGELVPLEDELTLVRSYLFIEQTRYENRLRVEWDIDEAAELPKIPPYSIQPLVENAIRHGVMKRNEAGTVRIKLAKRGDGTEISVMDDGVGMEEDIAARLLEKHSGGIALRNVDLRLKRLYGTGLSIVSSPGAGTTVSFVIRLEPPPDP